MRPRRAQPLDPDARRAQIIEEITPLLVSRGATVTTRELAAAAGVAEGTLFSVFEDKRSLVLAAIETRLDPGPLTAAVLGLADASTLEEKLHGVAAVVMPRLAEVHALAVVANGLTDERRRSTARQPAYMREWLASVSGSVAELIAPHSPELRLSPLRFARLFLTLLLASSMPLTTPEEPEVLVGFCLRGALKPEGKGA